MHWQKYKVTVYRRPEELQLHVQKEALLASLANQKQRDTVKGVPAKQDLTRGAIGAD